MNAFGAALKRHVKAIARLQRESAARSPHGLP
jgi:hypothetical protein